MGTTLVVPFSLLVTCNPVCKTARRTRIREPLVFSGISPINWGGNFSKSSLTTLALTAVLGAEWPLMPLVTREGSTIVNSSVILAIFLYTFQFYINQLLLTNELII